MPEETGEETFASKNDKIRKQSSDEPIDKKAETRDERLYNRQQQKNKKKRDDSTDELEISLDKRLKPERTDVKNVKLFADDQSISIPDIPMIDIDKAEEIGKQLVVNENSKNAWVETMRKDLDLNQNARRAAINLENELLSLDTNISSDKKREIFSVYVPQLFASKINDNIPIYDKVIKAKEQFRDSIDTLIYDLDTNLNSNLTIKSTKLTIRRILKDFFTK
jgi:hypothetical protein